MMSCTTDCVVAALAGVFRRDGRAVSWPARLAARREASRRSSLLARSRSLSAPFPTHASVSSAGAHPGGFGNGEKAVYRLEALDHVPWGGPAARRRAATGRPPPAIDPADPYRRRARAFQSPLSQATRDSLGRPRATAATSRSTGWGSASASGCSAGPERHPLLSQCSHGRAAALCADRRRTRRCGRLGGARHQETRQASTAGDRRHSSRRSARARSCAPA